MLSRLAFLRGLCAKMLTAPVLVFLTGLLASGTLAFFLLRQNADEQTHEKALMLMRTLSAVQHYADEDLGSGAGNKANSSFATRKVIRYYTDVAGEYPYSFRMVANNPTNLLDRPDPYETQLIAQFADSPLLHRIEGDVVLQDNHFSIVATPIMATDKCMKCHSTPSVAPADRVRIYGRTAGFGWRRNTVVGVQVVYVPSSPARAAAIAVFWKIVRVIGGLSLICCILLIYKTWALIAAPILRMTKTSKAIRQSDWGARFNVRFPDEIAELAISFQDTTFWLRSQLAKEEKLRSMFQQFVPAAVAAKALGKESDDIITGSRQSVSIMIINIRNFKLLMEHLPPDQTVTTLNEFFTAVNQVIVAHKGMVNKYLGDSVMATFGMPIGNDDHALRAVRAALAIPRALQALYVRLEENYGWELGVGIGISTGEPIVGHFGSSMHMEYAVLGDVVGEAQAMETLTKNVPEEDTIVICEQTYRSVMSEVHVYDLGERPGKDGKPYRSYVVQGLRSEARSILAA